MFINKIHGSISLFFNLGIRKGEGETVLNASRPEVSARLSRFSCHRFYILFEMYERERKRDKEKNIYMRYVNIRYMYIYIYIIREEKNVKMMKKVVHVLYIDCMT